MLTFSPPGYPRHWLERRNIHRTEQYLLMALLLGNDEYQVQLGGNCHRLFDLPAREGLMHGRATAKGGSSWFRKEPRRPR